MQVTTPLAWLGNHLSPLIAVVNRDPYQPGTWLLFHILNIRGVSVVVTNCYKAWLSVCLDVYILLYIHFDIT